MKLKSRIDLNLLAVFEAIYSRESVSQAARHLNLSQSAISHALARLRREFDDQLFVRAGNAFIPTALAKAIIDPVQCALRGVELAVAEASRFDPATATRQFSIGFRQSNEARMLGDLVARLARASPGVRLASVSFRRGDLAGALAKGDLDMAIDIPSNATLMLRSLPLQSDHLVVAARPGHPLFEKRFDLEAYTAADHIMVSLRSSGPGAEDEALTALGAQRRVAVRCQNILTAWQIVAASDLILTLHHSHAQVMQDVSRLKLVPLPIPIAPREVHLFWHETADRDPGNAWFRNIVREAYEMRSGHESCS